MNEYILIVLFVLWYIFALLISENLGKKKKLGVEWSFFLSILLSPVIGYLLTQFSGDKK